MDCDTIHIDMKYEAVIFDLFGTLVDKFSLREHKSVLRQMASVLHISPDDFIQLWFDTFNERGLGVFQTIEENVEYICRKLNIHPEDTEVKTAARINLEYTARGMRPRSNTEELLSHLKAHGYKTGLISNCSTSIPEIFKDMPFATLIDEAVFSSLVGLQKPDPRIYQIATDRLGVKPQECLYVGDGDSQELSGAAAVGMHAVLIYNPDEDSADVHRVNAETEEWDSHKISSLMEVISLLS